MSALSPRCALLCAAALACACASSPDTEATVDAPQTDEVPGTAASAVAAAEELAVPGPPRPPAELFVTSKGEVRDAGDALLHAQGRAPGALRAAVATPDDLRLVDVAADAPAAAIVALVQAAHAPEAAPCVVRLRWPDVVHDVARPAPPTSGPRAELPVIVRVDAPYARITPPTSGGTGWLRVPSDDASLLAALRAEAARANTTRAIVSFPRTAPGTEVARALTLLTDAGYTEITFAGTF